MGHWRSIGCVAIVTTLASWTGSAHASANFVEEVQAALYAGKTAEAAVVAGDRLAKAPDDDQARFALGAVQFLQAIEHLGQSLHRYGLRSSYQDPTGLAGLPILRIPVPHNPNPDKLTYEAFRAVLQRFADDLAAADTTLAGISGGALDLPLNIGLIRLDLNADGASSDDEALWLIFMKVADARWLNEREAGKLLVDFDASDVPWLRAYTHLLMAIVEFPLAHDWRDAFEATFHGVFPGAGLPLSVLFEEEMKALEELQKQGEALYPPPKQPTESWPEYQSRHQAWLDTPNGRKWQRRESLKNRIEYGGIADLIAFVHLNHWPVVEPERMQRVLEHFEAMIMFSRENWRRIRAETDDRNEWIPSTAQSGVLPRMRVTEERVAGWMQFLDEFEALLQGRKLLPHWRFDRGINMRRMFLEPSTFDIVLLIQGSAAVPYLEEGELTTGQTWRQITRVFGGDFFRYFIWFN